MILIGLGGNLGTDAELLSRIEKVRTALDAFGRATLSPTYVSDPLDAVGPRFLNACIRLELGARTLLPYELLRVLLDLERLLGRRRSTERNEPRTLDLDILLWDDLCVGAPEDILCIPHPRMASRKFVLLPAIDLLGATHRLGQRTLTDLLSQIENQACQRLVTS